MPLITETYYLSLTQDNRGILRLRCSQNDTLRTVNLKLYNNGSIFVIPSGISAYVSGVKQNGAVFSKSCTISQDRKSVVLQLSSDITNVDGIIVAEIVLNDGEGGRLGTSNFIIQVEKNPIRAGVVQDTETPIEYINDFIEKIQTLTARLNNLITPSGDPSLAEVVDARMGILDSTTYQTLGARLNAEFQRLSNALNGITILESTGDTTDRTSEILSKLNAYGTCKLGKGDFYVNSLVMPEGSHLVGSSNLTRIVLPSSVTNGYVVKPRSNCIIENVSFYGGFTGTHSELIASAATATRHCIILDRFNSVSSENVILNNIFINNFVGSAIIQRYATGCHCEDIIINMCYAGIDISNASYDGQCTNISMINTRYGVVQNGSNFVFTNCISKDSDQHIMSDQQNTECTFSSCTFFDSSLETTSRLATLSNVRNGFVFDNCIFDSSLRMLLNACDGIVIKGTNFVGSDTFRIIVSNGRNTLLLITDCIADVEPVVTNAGTAARITSCYLKDGTAWSISEADIDITVDDELSDESENPVQNKVINRTISEIKADLVDVYSSGSTPFVDMLDDTDTTHSGISYSLSGNTLSCDGTSTDTSQFVWFGTTSSSPPYWFVGGGKYIVSIDSTTELVDVRFQIKRTSNTSLHSLAIYSKSGKYILDVPEDITVLRVVSIVNSGITLNNDTLTLDIERVIDVDSDMSELRSGLGVLGIKNELTWNDGSYKTDGTISTNVQYGNRYSNIIDATTFNKLTITPFLGRRVCVAFFDRITGAFVSRSDYTTESVTIDNTYSVGINLATTYTDRTISTEDLLSLVEIYRSIPLSKWTGRKAAFVGDSITYGSYAPIPYHAVLNNMIGFSDMYVDGVAGSAYSVTATGNYTPISQRWQNIPTDRDLVVIFAGTNDWGHDAPIGTPADTTDVSMCGALSVVINGILTANPSARLVLITPLHRWGYTSGNYPNDTDNNGQGHPLADYVDAIKDMAQAYSIPVIDLFSDSGLNPRIPAISTAFFQDGLHPINAGHARLARQIASELEVLNFSGSGIKANLEAKYSQLQADLGELFIPYEWLNGYYALGNGNFTPQTGTVTYHSTSKIDGDTIPPDSEFINSGYLYLSDSFFAVWKNKTYVGYLMNGVWKKPNGSAYATPPAFTQYAIVLHNAANYEGFGRRKYAYVSETESGVIGNNKASMVVDTVTFSNENYVTYSISSGYTYKLTKRVFIKSISPYIPSGKTLYCYVLKLQADGTYSTALSKTFTSEAAWDIGLTLEKNDALLFVYSGGTQYYSSTNSKDYFTKTYGWNSNTHKIIDSNLAYYIPATIVLYDPISNYLLNYIEGGNPCNWKGTECSLFDNILCIGDSITQGAPTPPNITPDPSKATRTVSNQTMYSYPASMKKQWGVECTNWGRSGIDTPDWYDYYSENEPSWSGHDAAIMLIGNNDYHIADDMGGLTPENLPTVSALSKSAMMDIITKLKADNADIKIFICTLLPGWDTGNSLSPYVVQNIRDIAEDEDNVYLIDLAKYSIIKGDSPYMFGHPTALGYNQLAREIGGAIGYTIVNNPDDFRWVQFIGTEYAMDEQ